MVFSLNKNARYPLHNQIGNPLAKKVNRKRKNTLQRCRADIPSSSGKRPKVNAVRADRSASLCSRSRSENRRSTRQLLLHCSTSHIHVVVRKSHFGPFLRSFSLNMSNYPSQMTEKWTQNGFPSLRPQFSDRLLVTTIDIRPSWLTRV